MSESLQIPPGPAQSSAAPEESSPALVQSSPTPEQAPRRSAALRTRFLSHGTLGCRDLELTRRFYEEFLGLEVVRTSPVSLMIRLGGNHVYAVVQTRHKDKQARHYHNGLDVETDADVDEAWRLCSEQAAKWGLHDISKPSPRHGTYSFLFWDLDDNCWEILSNPKDGYTWIFEQGDLSGKGHFERGFRHKRPDAAQLARDARPDSVNAPEADPPDAAG